MKAKMQGLIKSIKREGGDMILELTTNGKVDTNLLNAKSITADIICKVKATIGENLSMGKAITITVSDEEEKVSDYFLAGGM